MTQQIQNAIDKARRVKCSVKLNGGRSYLVVTPQQRRYTVRALVFDGRRFMACNCKAGARNLPCYHAIHAATLDTAIQDMRAH